MTTPQLKTAQQFRDFFAAIPDEKWSDHVCWTNGIQCCAYGHLGVGRGRGLSSIPSAVAFDKLDRPRDFLWTDVNDGRIPRFNQSTPKARILAALDEIISKEKEQTS